MPTLALTLILSGLSMIGPLGIDTYLPSFPSLAREFAVDPLVVQQTLTAYVSAFAAMMLFSGTVSDSFGRRPVLLVSLLCYAVAAVGAAAAPSIGWLIFLRALQGMSAGAGVVIGRAVVQDRFEGAAARRVMSHITMVFGLAPAIAPVLGGWLQATLGWRSVFVFLAVFGAGMWLACWRGLPESLPPERRHPFHLLTIVRRYLQVGLDPSFMTMSLGLGFVYCGIPLYIGSAASFVMTILHLPETAFAWMFVPLVGGLMLGAMLAARRAGTSGARQMIRLGYLIMFVSVALNAVYASALPVRVPWAVLPLFGYGFGLALAGPSMTVMALSLFPEMRGLAASLQGFLQMMIFALVSGFVAPLVFDSAAKLAYCHLAGLALSLVLWRRGCRRVACGH
ncbi:multidrug effflux MFS transporter [Paludibacterium yongneupense]|uniref:multidrug effflux MFS transporter n=1 Tax=Paludibacterium yongneupense TaxID=400061 RepID=UPI00040E8DD2|nr:multidrug effflux MFS transporter [Paludibacterium yongneupense]